MIGAEGEHRIEDRRRRRCGLRCKMRRETKRASTSDFVVEGPHPPPTGNHCVGRGQKEKKAEKREKRRRGNWGGEWWGRVGGWVARGTAAPSTTPREESQQQRRETPPLPSGPGRPAGLPPPLHPAVGHAESAWPSGSFASLLVCVCGVWCV